MILLLLLAVEQPKVPECVIDRCEDEICVVETPEGWVDIPRKRNHYEGKVVECPLYLIEPT